MMKKLKINKKVIYFLIITLCYLPAFIAFMPIIFSYDGPDELYALANDVQPYIYTILIKTFSWLSIKLTKGVDMRNVFFSNSTRNSSNIRIH